MGGGIKRLLYTRRMVLGNLLNSLMAAHLLDPAGYSTSSALQTGPSSGTKLVWLPKSSPNDLGGTMLSPLHQSSSSSLCVLSSHLLLQMDDLECDSVDITTAFLNGDLEEEIYMKPPEGYEQYSRDGRLLYCLFLRCFMASSKEVGSGTSSSVR